MDSPGAGSCKYLESIASELLGVGGGQDLVPVNRGVDNLCDAVAVREAHLSIASKRMCKRERNEAWTR